MTNVISAIEIYSKSSSFDNDMSEKTHKIIWSEGLSSSTLDNESEIVPAVLEHSIKAIFPEHNDTHTLGYSDEIGNPLHVDEYSIPKVTKSEKGPTRPNFTDNLPFHLIATQKETKEGTETVEKVIDPYDPPVQGNLDDKFTVYEAPEILNSKETESAVDSSIYQPLHLITAPFGQPERTKSIAVSGAIANIKNHSTEKDRVETSAFISRPEDIQKQLHRELSTKLNQKSHKEPDSELNQTTKLEAKVTNDFDGSLVCSKYNLYFHCRLLLTFSVWFRKGRLHQVQKRRYNRNRIGSWFWMVES